MNFKPMKSFTAMPIGLSMMLAALYSAMFTGNVSAQAYKWVDEKGVVHYGDTLPPEAAKKQNAKINSQGRKTDTSAAQLTPEQIAARDAELARKKERDEKVAERRRLDNMLMSTYSKESDFQTSYERNAGSLKARLSSIDDRLKGLEERERKVLDEMEFYTAGKSKKNAKKTDDKKAPQVPPQLTADHERITKERAQLQKERELTTVDLNDLKARIDGEKARWTQLRGGMLPGTLDDSKAEEPKKADTKTADTKAASSPKK
jgi:chromosome segregation ATPase